MAYDFREVMSSYFEVLKHLERFIQSELRALGIKDWDNDLDKNVKPSNAFLHKLKTIHKDFETLEDSTLRAIRKVNAASKDKEHVAVIIDELSLNTLMNSQEFVKDAIKFLVVSRCLVTYVAMKGLPVSE